MKKVLIIPITEIINGSFIDDNVDHKILSKTLAIVQETAYKAILGGSLYDNLINAIYEYKVNSVNISSVYASLIDISKPYLIAKTVSDFIITNQYKISNKGLLKLNDNSATAISESDLQAVKDYYDNLISTYKKELIEFLKRNRLTESDVTDDTITEEATGWYFGGDFDNSFSTSDTPDIFIDKDVYLVSGSFNNGQLTLTNSDSSSLVIPISISSSYVSSSHFSNNQLTLVNSDDSSIVTTIDSFSGLSVNGILNVTGSIIVSNGITGSLLGTASVSINAISSSYPIFQTGSSISTQIGASYPVNPTDNILLGRKAGSGSLTNFGYNIGIGYEVLTSASNTFDVVAIGYTAGRQGINIDESTIVGSFAGDRIKNAEYSTLIGQSAGYRSSFMDYSVFIGANAFAFFASESYYSVGIGTDSMNGAFNTSYCVAIGYESMYGGIKTEYSTIIGHQAGARLSSASGSILIGNRAGYKPLSGGTIIGSNNIIIGNNITLPAGRKDSINIGAIIFGTGSYANIFTGNPSATPVLNGKIGILTSNPQYTLDVSGSGRFTNGVIVTGSLEITPSGSFVFPLTSTVSPKMGSAYWSEPYLFIWNGARYMSASFS